jgi:hypothetical protein
MAGSVDSLSVFSDDDMDGADDDDAERVFGGLYTRRLVAAVASLGDEASVVVDQLLAHRRDAELLQFSRSVAGLAVRKVRPVIMDRVMLALCFSLRDNAAASAVAELADAAVCAWL